MKGKNYMRAEDVSRAAVANFIMIIFYSRCGAEIWTCYGKNGVDEIKVHGVTFR